MRALKQKYYTQKAGAKVRGIEWHFTYDTWIEWWGDDIVNRGNKCGQLVMARVKDQGPYHPDNVQKITCNENHKQAHKNGLGWSSAHKHTAETCAKISSILKNKEINREHLVILNASKKGVPRPIEVRKKISETLLAKKWILK